MELNLIKLLESKKDKYSEFFDSIVDITKDESGNYRFVDSLLETVTGKKTDEYLTSLKKQLSEYKKNSPENTYVVNKDELKIISKENNETIIHFKLPVYLSYTLLHSFVEHTIHKKEEDVRVLRDDLLYNKTTEKSELLEKERDILKNLYTKKEIVEQFYRKYHDIEKDTEEVKNIKDELKTNKQTSIELYQQIYDSLKDNDEYNAEKIAKEYLVVSKNTGLHTKIKELENKQYDDKLMVIPPNIIKVVEKKKKKVIKKSQKVDKAKKVEKEEKKVEKEEKKKKKVVKKIKKTKKKDQDSSVILGKIEALLNEKEEKEEKDKRDEKEPVVHTMSGSGEQVGVGDINIDINSSEIPETPETPENQPLPAVPETENTELPSNEVQMVGNNTPPQTIPSPSSDNQTKIITITPPPSTQPQPQPQPQPQSQPSQPQEEINHGLSGGNMTQDSFNKSAIDLSLEELENIDIGPLQCGGSNDSTIDFTDTYNVSKENEPQFQNSDPYGLGIPVTVTKLE